MTDQPKKAPTQHLGEWTPETVQQICGKCALISTHARNVICDAHNAALAAERADYDKLHEQLALVESQRSNQALAEALLQAQAAMAEHNKLGWHEESGLQIKADLSALKKHDTEIIEKDRLERRDVLEWEQGYKCAKAELVKPLVDLLREARGRLGNTAFPSLAARIDAALAKVKP